ncbi:hypothetical protein HME01_34230 [Vreelandella aquamarina]|jgi:hypothetical protein|uniref:Uncharacterized protein n=1 Tax=Vreelandella aquamarina TaxID=77097 RepID=A0A1N6DGE0_9GAMM|nr:hypothetical protein HME01_34230 [Halomonas meridiana]SIN61330.1 hypothetical protein SAMN05878438_0499 [Halomonas meridiana]SIN69855.1 hypothetical protein SAMN05878249_2719 [Halomonas meridiana]SIO27072.1 hypothetical protein SAMN05878442_1888 [Halomonas meridiana]
MNTTPLAYQLSGYIPPHSRGLWSGSLKLRAIGIARKGPYFRRERLLRNARTLRFFRRFITSRN